MRLTRSRTAPSATRVALHKCRSDLCARVAGLRTLADAAFVQDFPALVRAVEAGFHHEETLLELLGDVRLHPRRADNAVILSALHRTLPQVEQGDVALGRQLADALDAILAAHGAGRTH